LLRRVGAAGILLRDIGLRRAEFARRAQQCLILVFLILNASFSALLFKFSGLYSGPYIGD
jgi:hypothetical protein